MADPVARGVRDVGSAAANLLRGWGGSAELERAKLGTKRLGFEVGKYEAGAPMRSLKLRRGEIGEEADRMELKRRKRERTAEIAKGDRIFTTGKLFINVRPENEGHIARMKESWEKHLTWRLGGKVTFNRETGGFDLNNEPLSELQMEPELGEIPSLIGAQTGRQKTLETLVKNKKPGAQERLNKYLANILTEKEEEYNFRFQLLNKLKTSKGGTHPDVLKSIEAQLAKLEGQMEREREKAEPGWTGLVVGPQGGMWQKGPEGQMIRRGAPEKTLERIGAEATARRAPEKTLERIGAEATARRAPEKPSALESKIAILRKTYPDIDNETLTGIASGTIKMKTDPVSGETTIVDVARGTEKPIKEYMPIGQIAVKKDEKGKDVTRLPSKTMWEYSGLGTGPWSAFWSGASAISGMFGGPVASETIKARQRLSSASFLLVTALQNSPRFNEGERKAIAKELSLAPEMFQPGSVWRDRARSINEYLNIKLQGEKDASIDTNLPAQERKQALRNAKNIKNFLKLLGVPPTFNSPNDQEFKDLKPGSQFFDAEGKLWQK